MILFPTFNHVLLLFLYVYLGLVSGIIFKIIDKFSTLIKAKVDKPFSHLKKEKIETSTNYGKTKKKLKNTENISKIKKQKQAKNHLIIFKIILNKTRVYLVKGFSSCILIVTLVCLVFVSFLINLQLNFGEIRIIYVCVWVLSFFVGKRFFNLLANYITNFYNYLCKRKSKNGTAE